MRLETLDGPTRARVLGYVREVGGIATHATGGVVRVTLPAWQAVVELATWLGLDAAEWSTEIVDLAVRLATPAACLGWVQSHIEWRDEPGERLCYPTITLERGAGDCDDTASLLVAMFTAIGYPAVVCACTLDGVPVHGVAAVQLASGWHWADGSEPRDLGPWREHPLASDARPGVRGVITPAPSMLRWPVLACRHAHHGRGGADHDDLARTGRVVRGRDRHWDRTRIARARHHRRAVAISAADRIAAILHLAR